MSDALWDAFGRALDVLGGTAAAVRLTGRPYRTVQNWKLGLRDVPPDAARELARAIRTHCAALQEAAAALEYAAGQRTPTGEGGRA